MAEAAFSHSPEAEGRRLKIIWLLAEYQSQSKMLNLFKIRLDSILFADLILIWLINVWACRGLQTEVVRWIIIIIIGQRA